MVLSVAIMMVVVASSSSAAAATAQQRNDDFYLNIPDEYIVFNDESALTKRENLESQQYNDFIHTLYKFDADNLQKFENLHHSGSAATSAARLSAGRQFKRHITPVVDTLV